MRTTITLNDVAIAAQVSKSTVANVFSRPARVRPDLRTRIEAVAREIGYAGPDPRGRLLSLGKVNAIGVVPPADAGLAWSFSHPYMQNLLTGIAEVCDEKQVGLLCISYRTADGGSGIRNAVVDGMILGTPEQAELVEPALRKKLPFVVTDAEGGEDMASLRFDDRNGAGQLVRHLLSLGHRRFAFAFNSRRDIHPIRHWPGEARPRLAHGYEMDWAMYHGGAEALAEAGLPADDIPLIEATGSPAERRDYGDFGDMLMDMAPNATAFVSFSSSLGYPLLDAVKRRGLAVPGQVSVASFGDRPAVERTDPPLTSVVHPISDVEKGRMAARMLFEPERRHVLLPLEFVAGGSSGPAPR